MKASARRASKPPGGVRLEDVARVAGVSPISVSRALGNPGRVSEAMRRKVAEAVAKTGFVLNSHASTLKSGRSTLIPVFVSSIQNAHFANALQGASDAFEGSRYHLVMAQTNYSDRLEQEMVDSVLPFKPAAVMFTGMVQSKGTRETLKRLAVPVMEMWDYSPTPIDMLVGFSNAEGGRLMGEHFGQRGFRKIAYAGRTRDRGAQRLAGFQEGLALYGSAPALVLPMEGPRTVADGGAALERILQQLPDCEAIFFATDSLALGAILRAAELEIEVPKTLAIAGYGDLDIARHIAPSLTTIHVGAYDMGLRAGKMLRARLESKELASTILRCPIQLEVRTSTTP
ncbi:MAG: LacI family DNA-binding transcriptional regulator [Devosia nanyangense]|uniref:LacI family DNA-binding transcriptional regulator n=1 Tax=Devosia nanyangense TaxID=1228055 RepID=A0A933L2B6_9HYPH|nr:LacI family DNA-binding transcriptional regulator [Devosia nanyangense]